MSERSGVYDLLLVLLGAIIALLSTVLTELWLIPTKQQKLHHQELLENRLSRLYTPLILATGKGQFSMTGDIVFYKVREIMDQYGYLGDQEVINKYIDFFALCRFANYDDLRRGSSLSKPLPDDVIIEIVKQRRPPLKWDEDSLKKATQVEKDFNQVLLKHYKRAREAFSMGNEERSGR